MNDIDRLGGSTERKIGKEIERRGRERDACVCVCLHFLLEAGLSVFHIVTYFKGQYNISVKLFGKGLP